MKLFLIGKKIVSNRLLFTLSISINFHNRIFALESFAHLRLVFDEYSKLTGHDIEAAIKGEMSSSVQRAFLAVGTTI